MPEFTVVLVAPKIGGNVGAVARSMANFGLEDLRLVRPCKLGDEAFRRAKHGRPILEGARSVANLEDALGGTDLSVGSTGIPTTSEHAFHRHAWTPRELGEKLSDTEGKVALVLGRENYGLLNDELVRLDLLVHVPCRPDHPVMNVSHAAAILFYELTRSSSSTPPTTRLASGFEKDKLLGAFDELLTVTRYPAHKHRRTAVMFRRLVGRALPTKWEFHALMGVLRGASKAVRRLSGSPGPDPSS